MPPHDKTLAYSRDKAAICSGWADGLPAYSRRLTVNFQVTVLKVLVSYPDGFASLSDLKRDVAILATSGREWSERTTKLAARMPELEIFGQGLVERATAAGRLPKRRRNRS